MLFLVGLGFLVTLRSINVFVFEWLIRKWEAFSAPYCVASTVPCSILLHLNVKSNQMIQRRSNNFNSSIKKNIKCINLHVYIHLRYILRLKHSKIMFGDCSGEELRNRFSVPSLFEVSTLLFLARTTLKYNAFEYPTTCRDWSKPNNYSKVFVYIETTASFEGLELWLRLW